MKFDIYKKKVGTILRRSLAGRRISCTAFHRYRIAPCRAAEDVAICYADPSKARQELGWRAQYGLPEIMRVHGTGSQ
jgi:UDP-glucose 4-epimerase